MDFFMWKTMHTMTPLKLSGMMDCGLVLVCVTHHFVVFTSFPVSTINTVYGQSVVTVR